MPPGFDNFNSSFTQKSHHILVLRLASVPHKLPSHRCSKWLELYFLLLLSESPSSRPQWYPFWNSDIPTSQSVLKQSYTEETNRQNNNDKAKKPTLDSHSISVNYCNILAYFHVTHNTFKWQNVKNSINCLPHISDMLSSFYPATEHSVTEHSIGD